MRSHFATIAAAVLLLAIPGSNTLAAVPKPPNVVLIFCDDMAYADVGCFGATGWKTPNLDRMASEGIKFSRFYVAQPVCSASRAALLTGCYSSRVGIHGALGPKAAIGLNPDEVTIAEIAKQKNYATAMFGKWHLGRPEALLPVHQGFDEYFGLPYSNDMWPHHPEAKAGTYPPLPLIEGTRILKDDLSHEDQAQLTTWYTERAVKFIEKNRDSPFFLYVAHNMPHVPLHVSAKFKGKSQQGLYGDVIEEIDWSVGEILSALKKNGLDDQTLVIFTSDNGPWLSYGNHAGNAGPLREGKGTCWEGGLREPFIARWPGKIAAGSTCKEPAMTIDVLPTVAKLIGADLPKQKIDGLDIWPLLSGDPKAKSPHEALFFYYENNQLQGLTSGKWKLMLAHSYRTMEGQAQGADGKPGKYKQMKIESPELYDLEADTGEKTNVAAQHSDVVQRLLSLAEKAREDLGDSLNKRKGTGVREPGRVPTADQ